MHILLTRPLEDCSEMILSFKTLGHKVSHLPLLNIESIKHDEINFSDFKAIIFTSSNAIKFLNVKNIDKNIYCFCVGNATERKARSVGFQKVFVASGNVSNLIEIVHNNFEPSDGRIIYISGEVLSKDLDKELINEGYDVEKKINYRTLHNELFDERFVKQLKLDLPQIVYIYSQNSALSFLNFIKNYHLESLWMNTNLMCIGEKTSSILNEIKWKKIFLFNPGEEEFLLYKI
jgi:uroporphyrinogen-III synthase